MTSKRKRPRSSSKPNIWRITWEEAPSAYYFRLLPWATVIKGKMWYFRTRDAARTRRRALATPLAPIVPVERQSDEFTAPPGAADVEHGLEPPKTARTHREVEARADPRI